MQFATFDDAAALEQAGGSHELAAELFRMLVRELPQFELGLRTAFDRHDLQMLERTAHKLNGAATYCGVPALNHAAQRLESSLKRGESGQIEPGLNHLLHEIRQVLDNADQRLGQPIV